MESKGKMPDSARLGDTPRKTAQGTPAQETPTVVSAGAGDQPLRLGLLLLPGFDLLALGGTVEVLRTANQLANRPLYRWRPVTETGGAAASASGLALAGSGIAGEMVDFDRLLIFGGDEASRHDNPMLIAWLRQLARRGCTIGGVGGAVWLLARAGLVEGRQVAVPRTLAPAFSETFTQPIPANTPTVLESDRLSCSGGSAMVDLMLDLVSHDHGHFLAGAVSQQLCHRWLHADTPERGFSPANQPLPHPKLAACVEKMRENTEVPLDSPELAEQVGLSVRHLERLFVTYLGTTPQRFYRTVRLEHARRLLVHTDMSITEVALASGFASASHFARAFREEFECSPNNWRQERRTVSDYSVQALL